MSRSLHRRRPPTPWSLDLDALDRARILANLSYEQLGRRANVHRSSLAVIFQGRHQPTMGTAHAVARALELGPSEVITFDTNHEREESVLTSEHPRQHHQPEGR